MSLHQTAGWVREARVSRPGQNTDIRSVGILLQGHSVYSWKEFTRCDAVGPLDQANKNCGGFAHQRGGFAEEENLHLVAGFG